jgi:hypothetical protein
MSIGISIGWNCNSASQGIILGLRDKKENGYMTCPFDMAITNYKGIVECIDDDFKYLTDPLYLELIKPKFNCGGINVDDYLIYHKKYKFIFNHESPKHANLANDEKWKNGENHFVENNFKEFKIRYEKRINNFYNYINSGKKIIFLQTRYESISDNNELLINVLRKKFSNLDFSIDNMIIDYSNEKIEEYNNHHILMNSYEELNYYKKLNKN